LNRDEEILKKRKYRELNTNKDKATERNKNYRELNKIKINEKNRKYIELKNKEKETKIEKNELKNI